jgi:hypothetical protein
LARWQPRQALAQAVTSVERPFHTYLEEMRRRVARLPEWAVPWRCLKTCRRRSLGTSGWKIPVDESPMRLRSPTFCVMMRSPGLERRVCTCGQRIWRGATSLRSRGDLSAMAEQTQTVPAAAAAGRDSASATTLDVPGRNTSWLVYSEMKARWRCWLPKVGGETLCRAKSKVYDPSTVGRGGP